MSSVAVRGQYLTANANGVLSTQNRYCPEIFLGIEQGRSARISGIHVMWPDAKGI